MLALAKTLLSTPHHYFAQLPYNLNWAISGRRFHEFLEANPLTVVDVGARWDTPPELAGLSRYVNYHGFDADAEECARLQAGPPPGFRSYACHHAFIGSASEEVRFRLFKRRELSSLYRRAERFQRLFADAEEGTVERELNLRSSTLDQALLSGNVPAPDFLKLDTQGSELEILRAAPETLQSTLLVELEVEFIEVYQGQALFHQVHEFMLASGFELLYLNRVFQQRRNIYSGPARGQLTFGDALYARTEASWERFSSPALGRFAVLLIHYGHLDIAFQLTAQRPAIREFSPAFAHYLKPGKRGGVFKRALVSQFDKLLCLGLHSRKFNQIRTESDRSWPIR